MIKKKELKELIDNAFYKYWFLENKPWQEEKKIVKNDILLSMMKVINIIHDVGLPSYRKRLREVHCDNPLVVTMTID